MTPFECYKEYVALKNHFSGERGYDYFKYNGKMRLNESSFDTRPDKIFFAKLAKHDDPRGFLVANLVENSRAWIRDLAYSDSAEKKYVDWKRRCQSLMYSFSEEIKHLDEDFNSNFTASSGKHPRLLQLYMAGKVSLETVVMLEGAVKFSPHWNKKLKYDPVWEDVQSKIVKYAPFLKYDRTKVVDAIVETFAGEVS